MPEREKAKGEVSHPVGFTERVWKPNVLVSIPKAKPVLERKRQKRV